MIKTGPNTNYSPLLRKHGLASCERKAILAMRRLLFKYGIVPAISPEELEKDMREIFDSLP